MLFRSRFSQIEDRKRWWRQQRVNLSSFKKKQRKTSACCLVRRRQVRETSRRRKRGRDVSNKRSFHTCICCYNRSTIRTGGSGPVEPTVRQQTRPSGRIASSVYFSGFWFKDRICFKYLSEIIITLRLSFIKVDNVISRKKLCSI